MHIHIYNPSTSPPSLLAQVAAVHAACTTADPRAIATWRPPFTPQRLEAMTAWYADMLAPSATYGCMRGVPDALLASTSASTSTSAPAPAQDAKGPFAHLNTLILMLHPDGQRVAGFVILARALSESGPQRATVRMLSVDPELRRAGVARGLMAELERIAKSEGRWLLVSLLWSRRADCADIAG